MSKVSNTLNLFVRSQPGDLSESKTPAEALRRLHLNGEAGQAYTDVLRLGADDLEVVGREIDHERESLQQNYTNAAEAATALQKIEDLLTQADALATDNSKSGVGVITRKTNQKALDDLMKQIETTIEEASSNRRLMDGSTTLSAGTQTLKIDRVDLESLGNIVANGRSLNLSDLKNHKSLDTARHKPRVAAIAHESITAAIESVRKQRATIEKFQTGQLRPRLGDVATSFVGIYADRALTLGSTSDALQTAADIRAMLFTSATFAAAVGAEGWDKERVLALVSAGSSSSSSST